MSGKDYHLVYKTTNLVNGKTYIGVHSTNNIDDGYLGSGCIFKKALKKYGKENFKREILFNFDTLNQAYEKEKELVDLEFINQSTTYNCKVGGEQGAYSEDSKNKRMRPSQAHRKRVSATNLGGEDVFDQRILDIENTEKTTGWITKLSKKWGINKSAALSFIKKWHKDYRPRPPIKETTCDCGQKITCRSNNKRNQCLTCYNLSQRKSDFYCLTKNELQKLILKHSMSKIKKIYKIHDRSLHRVLAEKKISIPDRKKRKKDIFKNLDKEEVIKLKNNHSISELARQFHVSRNVIKRAFKDLNL